MAGGKPTRTHRPGLRIPPRPAEAIDVLSSFCIGEPVTQDFDNGAEAEEYARKIRAAHMWLRRHEDDPETGIRYDLRVSPKVYKGYLLPEPHGDGSYVVWAAEVDDELLPRWKGMHPDATEFWRVDFWAQPPQNKGFRNMSKDAFDAAVKNSAESRGIEAPDIVRRRRTVEIRGAS